ncbi:S1 RNA-binding domain-containing protein [Streptomyces sp. Da 82-17]|uniref:S1 RNA-binding domain-containing protein n=1 Tax=Streptomyces sp. Da 82-17 TaxID=3377116 RepID=UPI0038D3AE1C
MADWQARSPELWAWLGSLQYGDILTGTVAAIERYGVFVNLDDGPRHPVFPGVGFITVPELSWRHLTALTDVVAVGQQVTCAFLQFDTHNAEARLSLRALLPDPFRAFAYRAERAEPGRVLHGTVDKVAKIGVFVEVGDGVVGLVPRAEYADGELAALRAGDVAPVVVGHVDRDRRRVLLTRWAAADEFRAPGRSTP